jgi:hypothetical protein
LEDGDNEFGATVDALGTLPRSRLAEYDKDFVGWAHFEAAKTGRDDDDEE